MRGDPRDGFAAMEIAARAAITYRDQAAAAPRTATAGYAEMLAAFQAPLPEAGEPATQVIEALIAKATPGIRAATGPRFFGWVIGSSEPAGVAADWLTAAWGQNAGNQLAAPAAAAVEAVAAAWLLELLGLPPDAGVGFVTGATVANFVCLAAARSAVLAQAGWDVEKDGLFGAPPIQVVIGDEAHATVFAALKYLGLGAARVRRVDCDGQGRIRPDAFARALHGVTGPAIAIAQAGHINSGAFDPFPQLVPLARDAGAWLHVDGAFGLWARACPPRASLAAGVDAADSWATDGHKWLQTPYDCGYAIVRDAAAQRQAMTVSASYLPQPEGVERDPSRYVPELSRRARGFATWAMIRHLGRAGIADLVDRHCRIAAAMAAALAREPGVTVANDVVLNQLVVRFGDGAEGDRLTLAVVGRVQQDGIAFMGAAQWQGRWVMRISVSGAAIGEADAALACDAVAAAWRAVSG